MCTYVLIITKFSVINCTLNYFVKCNISSRYQFTIYKLQNTNMEDIFLRFDHISNKIFNNLDNQSLVTCRLVNKTWLSYLQDSKILWIRIIQWCTGNQSMGCNLFFHKPKNALHARKLQAHFKCLVEHCEK